MARGGWVVSVVSVVFASLLAPVAPARAAEIDVQVGLHVGYVWGRGWTAGPGLGVGSSLGRSRFGATWPTILVGGVSTAADVSLDEHGRLALRVHAGPELAAFDTCPALVIPVGVGVTWSFEPERPVTIVLLAFVVRAMLIERRARVTA